MARNAAQWAAILQKVGCSADIVTKWGSVFADEIYDGSFTQGDLDIKDWLPEILHESMMLAVTEENLNYSAQNLCKTWPSRFPTLSMAIPYAHAPEKLANFVYGGRMGNSRSDDGWTYRGRSPIQITGLANYQHMGTVMGQDLVNNPDLLSQPHYGLEACIHWWEETIPDSMLGETTSIRQRVNGGVIGLADVQALTLKVATALAAVPNA